jgi:hypothetical protein
MSHSVRLVAAAVCLMACLGRVDAQQPVPIKPSDQDLEKFKQVQKMKEEWEQQQRQFEQQEREWKLQLLRSAIETNDRAMFSIIADIIARTMPRRISSALFDGVQWERCLATRCPSRG